MVPIVLIFTMINVLYIRQALLKIKIDHIFFILNTIRSIIPHHLLFRIQNSKYQSRELLALYDIMIYEAINSVTIALPNVTKSD